MSGYGETDEFASILARLQEAPEDEGAWRDLFRHTWPFVITLCRRSLTPHGRVFDAEDVAQEVYLKFARFWRERRPSIADQTSLFSLLAVMSRQLTRDAARWSRRSKRDLRREQSYVDDGASAEAASEVELRDLLDRVCERLDGQDRQIMQLRLQGYELTEIAERLAASLRTVERRLQKIRGVLGPHLEPSENAPH